MDTISTVKIPKGHNSAKNVDGVMVLVFCTLSDNALYLYQVSGNIYLRVSEFLSGHNFHSELCKVASFQKKKNRWTVLNLCTSSDKGPRIR